MWKTAFKTFEVIWPAKADHITSDFLKAVFHKFYLVHSWRLTRFSILPIFLDFCYDQSGEKWQWKDDSPLTSVFLETNFSQKF